jgi:hypothetical protein
MTRIAVVSRSHKAQGCEALPRGHASAPIPQPSQISRDTRRAVYRTRFPSTKLIAAPPGPAQALTTAGFDGSLSPFEGDASMELSWINKLRITLVAAAGIVVIGILAWPMAAAQDPLAPVRAAHVGIGGTFVLVLLAFATGFAAYFIAWPHGREIGILAVPFGLAVWAGRSGPMRTLTQALDEPFERQALLASLDFEPVFWLLIVAAGFIGVAAAQRLRPASQGPLTISKLKSYLRPVVYANVGAALVVGALLAHFFTGVFARDLAASDNHAVAQPAIGQIIFAVIAAFAVAAFAVKKFFNLSYLWPAVASILITPFSRAIYYREETVARFVETEPATFFPSPIFAVLPLQLVALGAIGSVLGYWMAVRYEYWRTHESA